MRCLWEQRNRDFFFQSVTLIHILFVGGSESFMIPGLLLFVLTGGQPAPQPAITWQTLVQEATDLATLAELPAPMFSAHQVSSYDRASVTPDDPEQWFANQDRGHSLYDGKIKVDTPFYRSGPQQGKPAEGTFPAGTLIGVARHRRPVAGHVWAYSTDLDGKPDPKKPLQGYIPQDAWTPNAVGPVLTDIPGPGCLTRFWSSNPGEAGLVRIYLDDLAKPAIEGRLADLLSGRFALNDGQRRVLVFPSPWAVEVARGCTLRFPIPFAKRCLITVEKSDVQYQINYRRYPAETSIQTLQMSDLIKQNELIAGTAQRLEQLIPPEPVALARQLGHLKPTEPVDIRWVQLADPLLPAGEKRMLEVIQPPGAPNQRAIIYMECKVQAERLPEALRKTMVTITFDGAAQPQVIAPLGDFFGTAPGANTMATLPLRISASGRLTAHWIMPYAQSARIELLNRGEQPVTVQLELAHVPRSFTARSLYFHAAWKSDQVPTRPYRDWTLSNLAGTGHFVGTMVSVANPVKAWWGEGDTKIWIDGEAFPSHWGTGTEDDFGCGWADAAIFSGPWHAQPRRDSAEHIGCTSLFRCHLLDRVPFQQSLRFQIEVRHSQPESRLRYAATTYWYARPAMQKGAP